MSDEETDMEVDEPVPTEDEKRALYKKMNKYYWELEDDKVKYTRWTGEDFVPTLEGMSETSDEEDEDTTGRQHTSFSDDYEHKERVVDESTLLPEDEKCAGCYSLLPNRVGGICGTCSVLTYRKRSNVAVCDAPPQLKNNHEPLWNLLFKFKGCVRCKLVNLGVTKRIDSTPPPPCTLTGGYAYFQDLGSLNLRNLFPATSTATTGAVLVRVMNFSVENERVLSNLLVRFSIDDPQITNPYHFAQIVRREFVGATSTGKQTKKADVGLVAVQEDLINWSPDSSGDWTPVATCHVHSFCRADIFSLPYANTRNQIQTRVVNLTFRISLDYKYISRTLFNDYLLKRGMILNWNLASKRQPPWPQLNTQLGCIYLHGFELRQPKAIGMDDCIYIYIGHSKNDARRHDKSSNTSLIKFETAHSTAKKFKTELFYVQKPPKSVGPKPKKKKTGEGKPKKIEKIAPLFRTESKFIHAFLLAQLNKWSFKHFRPSYPLTTEKDKRWPDLEFGDDSLDKPIRLINRLITGENYSKEELDEVCQIPNILLNTDVELHYDWDSDCLKY